MKSFIDKLALGTVQLGLDYGINNAKGKPNKEESLKILNEAHGSGVSIFDTAYAYGNAEELLGEFLGRHSAKKKVKIITKLKPDILPDEIEGSLRASLKKLNVKHIDGCLLHNPEHLKNTRIIDALCKLQELGLVKHIGVSIYDEEDALYAAHVDQISYIQVPYNIFDQRLDKTNFFQIVKQKNKKVFARSAFLQGLLLMDAQDIPSHLQAVKPYLDILDEIISKYHISRKEAAFLFSLHNRNLDYVVFGVESLEQLEDNLEISRKPINVYCIEELKEAFSSVEKYIISPNLWKK